MVFFAGCLGGTIGAIVCSVPLPGCAPGSSRGAAGAGSFETGWSEDGADAAEDGSPAGGGGDGDDAAAGGASAALSGAVAAPAPRGAVSATVGFPPRVGTSTRRCFFA